MQTVLVIQLARFGDLVQTKRLVLSLLRSGAAVHLCVDVSLVPLAELLYPDCRVHGVTAHAGAVAADGMGAMLLHNAQVFKELKAASFDRVYSLNFSGLGFSLASLFEADRVTGYAMRDGQRLVSNWSALGMRWSRERRTGINLVDFWAWYAPLPIPGEEVNPPATAGGGGLGVVLAGRESRRSLPVPVLARMVATLFARATTKRLVLLGSRAEEGAARSLLRALPPNVRDAAVNLAGKTDWAGLINALEPLDLLLTPDTGTMHLAAHLGVPVLACFLSSAWCFETGPYGQGHLVLQAVTDCLPCLETRPCPYAVKCLHPFSQDFMLRYLATRKPEHCPDGVIPLEPRFDALGLSYALVPGAAVDVDPQKNGRREMRRFLLDHLGHGQGEGRLFPQNADAFDGPAAHALALRLYQEKDWVTDLGHE